MPHKIRPHKICFVYYWATSGGVERVFLNRGEALLRRYPELAIDIYFFNDCGGVNMVRRYSKARGLSDRLQVVGSFEPAAYQAVFVVDTPQLLDAHPHILGKVIMECHTPYAENRTYLQEWQNRLKILLVPSEEFRRVVEAECPGLRGKVKVVRNFVPRLPQAGQPVSLPDWQAQLFFYFNRIDEVKNFGEFVEGLAFARPQLREERGREPLGIVSGQLLGGYPYIELMEQHRLRGSILILPPVPFETSHLFMQMMRRKKAVFVSCSKGESFGLSVAEAMTVGLPVLLSDIPPHAALVSNRSKFLYPLGNARELGRKMAAVEEQYEEMSSECLELSRGFSEETFLTDWDAIFGKPIEGWSVAKADG